MCAADEWMKKHVLKDYLSEDEMKTLSAKSWRKSWTNVTDHMDDPKMKAIAAKAMCHTEKVQTSNYNILHVNNTARFGKAVMDRIQNKGKERKEEGKKGKKGKKGKERERNEEDKEEENENHGEEEMETSTDTEENINKTKNVQKKRKKGKKEKKGKEGKEEKEGKERERKEEDTEEENENHDKEEMETLEDVDNIMDQEGYSTHTEENVKRTENVQKKRRGVNSEERAILMAALCPEGVVPKSIDNKLINEGGQRSKAFIKLFDTLVKDKGSKREAKNLIRKSFKNLMKK